MNSLSNEFEDTNYSSAIGRQHNIGPEAPTNSRNEIVGLVRGRLAVPVHNRPRRVKLESKQVLGEAAVVDKQRVVLGPAGNVFAVGRQADKVLLVDVARVGADGDGLAHVPQAQLVVRRRRHDLFVVEELDVGHGLLVPAEDLERLVRVPQVVQVDTVVRRSERQVIPII